MANEQLVKYIFTELEKGVSLEKITSDIKTKGGWNDADISLAVEQAQNMLDQQKKGIAFFLFGSKHRAVLAVICISFILNLLLGYTFLSFNLSYILYFGTIILWPVIIILLFLFKKKKEGANLLKAIATLFLIFVALLLIGFGLCVLLFKWN